VTTADSPTPEPAAPAAAAPATEIRENTPGLIAIAAMIVGGFVLGGLVMAFLTRQTNQEVADLRASVSTLRQDLDRVRDAVKAGAVANDRTAVLTFPDSGFVALRTNAGTLLVTLEKVNELQNGVIVILRVGNPTSLTLENFSMTFEWDTQKSEQKFEHVLQPGQWMTIQATLRPADAKAMKSVRITAASVEQLRVQ
jgi:outer membrane murein-binding lipoprotein Lpp